MYQFIIDWLLIDWFYYLFFGALRGSMQEASSSSTMPVIVISWLFIIDCLFVYYVVFAAAAWSRPLLSIIYLFVCWFII
jgi:hypothetical protein